MFAECEDYMLKSLKVKINYKPSLSCKSFRIKVSGKLVLFKGQVLEQVGVTGTFGWVWEAVWDSR